MSREEELMRRLRAAFQIEAHESVDALATLLLELEKQAPVILASPVVSSQLPGNTIETVYREAHNLKGAARAVNMMAIEILCQPLESVFAVWKKSLISGDDIVGAETLRATLSPQAFDTLHAALKTANQVLDAESSGQSVPDVHGIARQLAALAQGQLPTDTAQRQQETDRRKTQERRHEFEERRQELEDRRSVERRQEEERRQASAPVQPVAEQRQSNERRQEERRADVSDRRDYDLDRRQTEDRRHVDERRGSDSTHNTATGDRRQNAGKAPESETVRIATAKLDALLLQAEELLTAKQASRRQSTAARHLLEQLAFLENEWAKVLPALRVLVENDGHKSSALLDFIEWHRAHLKKLQGTGSSLAAQLSGDGRALGGLIDALLEDTKKLLMLPCAALLLQFPRTVRDVARERGKEVEFFTSGGEVEVDKRILEAVKAPLLHLLRNAIDHGIEMPDERRAQGKAERATIDLSVTQTGGEVEFRVSDDGAGLNIAKIKERAVQNGLISADTALHLSDEAAAPLIFASDLSTSDKIDELSGRGLGMAIVRDQVERLGGRVTMETTPQRGTIFRLTLPQTLATFRGLLVEAADQIFVIPTADVTQVTRVRRDEIAHIGTRETIRLGGRTLRLLPLIEALGLPDSRSPGGDNKDSNWQVIVVLGGERGTAFGVDAILDEQEVLVKRLGWPLIKVRHVTGATVIADGRAAPILDVAELLRAAIQGGQSVARGPISHENTAQSAALASQKLKSVLVVDDSITSRMLLKDIFEASGFRVQTAVDGLDALTALRGGQFDLLVSDVDMPRLDGFSLVERVRAEPQFKDLPTVLVTGRDSKEDRERGFDAGASAYVVKSNFDQSNLLEIVRRLI